MKLPKMNLFVNYAQLAMASGRVGQQVIPAVTREERDESQNYINRYCHGLQNCRGTESCGNLLARGQQANQCSWHRFRVRNYYIERNIPEVGDHQRAIEINDNIANTCQGYYNRYCR